MHLTNGVVELPLLVRARAEDLLRFFHFRIFFRVGSCFRGGPGNEAKLV